MHFSQCSSENFRKFSQKFPVDCVFPLNAQKLNAGFVKFFEKYAQKSICSNFLNKSIIIFLKFFENLGNFFQKFSEILLNILKFFENFYKIFTKFFKISFHIC